MASDIALSTRMMARGRLARSRFLPSSAVLSCQSSIWRGIGGSSAVLLAEPRTNLPPRISPGPGNQDQDKTCRGQGETHQEAADASFTCKTYGAARQEPGRVVRHFCYWLLYCSKDRPGPRALLSVSRAPRGERRWVWCNDDADCARVWALSSSQLGQCEAARRGDPHHSC